ncbi:electron transport complex protein RnfC [Salmonella enterica subsp. enterica serovar Typhimurium]|nr:electron transport complex protein RnfC [Salmonella enterica subsp. enterica serovar Typhimurium]
MRSGLKKNAPPKPKRVLRLVRQDWSAKKPPALHVTRAQRYNQRQKIRMPIAAALARVKEKQAQATQPVVIQAGSQPDNSAVIAAREARKAQARAKQAAHPMADSAIPGDDPSKAAVEAAIARAQSP